MDKNVKNFAEANGLKVAKNVAYGSLRGYAATVSVGQGFIQIILSTSFPDANDQRTVEEALRQANLSKEYGVMSLNFFPKNIRITLAYTMKKHIARAEAFLAFFCPLLDEHHATGVNICPECGGDITAGCWKLINGIAYHMHTECGSRVNRDINAADQAKKDSDTGTYLTGFIGAFLGAALGGIVWGLILLIGYVASVVGLLVGFLAEKGYTLLKGKRGVGKVVILIFAIIFGVVFGTFFSDAVALLMEGASIGDLPEIFSYGFRDSDYMRVTIGNIVLGLIFAALGVFSLLKATGKEVSDTKVIDLE